MASADTEIEDGSAPPKMKRGLLIPMILGVILALGGGAGGFWMMSSGLLSGGAESEDTESANSAYAGESHSVSFIELEPLTISIGPESGGRYLIFAGHLEVPTQYQADIEHLTPRVLDVLNTYLRVVEAEELATPSSLLRLRSQMLRRVQLVTGDDRVNDLLVTQFVVN